MEKFIKYVKIVLVHLLILSAVGGITYAHVTHWVDQKEKQIQQEQIIHLQQELESLKASK